jgi:hypothetical protein
VCDSLPVKFFKRLAKAHHLQLDITCTAFKSDGMHFSIQSSNLGTRFQRSVLLFSVAWIRKFEVEICIFAFNP